MNLRDIQTSLPWTIKYSQDYRLNPQAHKDFAHAITHALKALGKLSEIVDDLDHRRDSELEPDKYISDLVICALRMANAYPGRMIDLESNLINRIETKNDVRLNQ